MNDFGQVVGSSDTANGQTHAFLYSNGTLYDLGTLGGSFSEARAINNTGQVVGLSTLANGQQRAFLYENGTMYDINNIIAYGTQWTIIAAYDIDDDENIAAAGTTETIPEQAVLLTPSAPDPITIPCPIASVLLAVGIVFAYTRLM